MDEITNAITVEFEGNVTITTEEYRELIECQTMLDMILDSVPKDPDIFRKPVSPSHFVIRAADYCRKRYSSPVSEK